MVDDQRGVVAQISDWLRRAGHVPVAAASGREAAGLLRGLSVDALITDLVMPNGNGIELIFDVRAAFPSMRIVAISSAEQTEAALAAGADRCLRKPLAAQDMIAALTGA